MFNKKRIIAVVAFLLLSFFLIAFASNNNENTEAIRNVTFIDSMLDKELETQQVTLGSSVTPPTATEYEEYIFLGWYIEGTDERFDDWGNITDDLKLEARYGKDANKNGIVDDEDTYYTVTFYDTINKMELSTQEVLVGMDALAPGTKIYTNYVFRGWNKAYTNVTEDMTVSTIYVSIVDENDQNVSKETYTVTFIDGETTKVISEVIVIEGASASTPAIPKHDSKAFSHWEGNYSNITKNEVVTAIYGDDLNNNSIIDSKEIKYSVIFNANGNGDLIGKLVYDNLLTGLTLEQQGVVIPTPTAIDGNAFNGWNTILTPNTVVTNNVIFTAQFKEVEFVAPTKLIYNKISEIDVTGGYFIVPQSDGTFINVDLLLSMLNTTLVDTLAGVTIVATEPQTKAVGTFTINLVDNTAPTITITEPTIDIYVKGNLVVSGTATDDLSGIDKVMVHLRKIKDNGKFDGFLTSIEVDVVDGLWTTTIDTTAFVDGDYGITVIGSDNVGNGNGGGTHLKGFIIDNNAPTGTFTYSNNNGNQVTNQDVLVTLITNEPINTPDGWTKVNDTTFTKEHSGNGKYTVTIEDYALNQTTLNYEVKRIDKDAPEFINLNDIYKKSITFSASKTGANETDFTVLDQNIDTVVFYNETTDETLKFGGNLKYNEIFTISNSGKYTVTATDKAGNSTTETFMLDNEKPVTVVISPTEKQVLKASDLQIKVESTDNVGLSKIVANLYNSNNKLLKSSQRAVSGTFATHEYDFSDLNLEDGEYYIKANALDEVENMSSTITRTFVIDNTAPDLVIDVVTDGYSNTENPQIHATDANPFTIIVKHNGIVVREDKATLNNGMYSSWFGIWYMEDGSYEVEAIDEAGNSKVISFILDRKGPEATLNGGDVTIYDINLPYSDAGITVSDMSQYSINTVISYLDGQNWKTVTEVGYFNDTLTPGTYVILYYIQDALGNKFTEFRNGADRDYLERYVTVLPSLNIKANVGSHDLTLNNASKTLGIAMVFDQDIVIDSKNSMIIEWAYSTDQINWTVDPYKKNTTTWSGLFNTIDGQKIPYGTIAANTVIANSENPANFTAIIPRYTGIWSAIKATAGTTDSLYVKPIITIKTLEYTKVFEDLPAIRFYEGGKVDNPGLPSAPSLF